MLISLIARLIPSDLDLDLGVSSPTRILLILSNGLVTLCLGLLARLGFSIQDWPLRQTVTRILFILSWVLVLGLVALGTQGPASSGILLASAPLLMALTGILVAVNLDKTKLTQNSSISEVQTLQTQLEQMQVALQHAESTNQAQQAFLATMSHEIRTPMNAVIGITGILLETPLTEQQRSYVDTIRTSSNTLLSIINTILDYSKLDSHKLELEHQPFNLRQCLEETLELVASQAAFKALELTYFMDPSAPTLVMGDETRLHQILLNLLSNAIKFTDKGEVALRVQSVHLNAISEEQGSYCLEFSVQDTGIGIKPDQLDRLFKPFSQVNASTARQYGGTGLGLVISQQLCHLFGGQMWVTSYGAIAGDPPSDWAPPSSSSSTGSTFYFTLPTEVAAEWTDEPITTHLEGQRILIVDDNDTNRQILTLQTEAWGLEVIAFSTATEAWEWVQSGQKIDIAILDFCLPDQDGVTLATQLRTALPHLPTLVLSSLGQPLPSSTAVTAALSKPVKQSSLLNILVQSLQPKSLPADPSDESSNTAELNMAASLPLQILVVDDNRVNQIVAVKMLQRLGYNPDVVNSGLAAIERLQHRAYDVVFMDVQMDGMDGLTAASRIRTLPLPQQPWIIAMTARALEGDDQACMAAGMNAYISKPIWTTPLSNALLQVETRSLSFNSTDPGFHPWTELPSVNLRDLEDFQDLIDSETDGFMQEIIQTCLDYLPTRMRAVQSALETEDPEQLLQAAHSLRSMCLAAGIIRLAQMAQDLENVVRAGERPKASLWTPALLAEGEKVLSTLENFDMAC